MIPVRLQLQGFLSYRHPVAIEFSDFELACISGHNGAGKSSLLDAITWVLFGQARRRDDAVINSAADAAEVSLEFDYEGNRYRVLRSKPRGKTTLLEFNLLDGDGNWKVLTEHTVNETEKRIERTLRMDYETFTNASFFLQGKADQFAQQRPGDRKRILSNILGLEVWETYREGAAARRKSQERRLAQVEGQLKEIESELAEEPARRESLRQLEARLEELSELRKTREKYLEVQSRLSADLEHQRHRVEDLKAQLASAEQRREGHARQLAQRKQEQAAFQEQVAHAAEIEADFTRWQSLRQALADWDKIAAQFYALQQERSPYQAQIQSEQARLEAERASLENRQNEVRSAVSQLQAIERDLAGEQTRCAEIQEAIQTREELKEELTRLKETQAGLEQENKALRAEMAELDERIQRLRDAEEENCPLCGSELTLAEREALIEKLERQGHERGDSYRANQSRLRDIRADIEKYDSAVKRSGDLERQSQLAQKRLADLEAHRDTILKAEQDWQQNFAARLTEIEKAISNEEYAADARRRSAELDGRLQALGYDPLAHETARQEELGLRISEERMRELEKARSALIPLNSQIKDLEAELTADAKDCVARKTELDGAEREYEEKAASLPDLQTLEKELNHTRSEENQKRLDVGAARQKVEVLAVLKERHKDLSAERSEISQLIARLKTLERAFGKDGVPALLIEQALPEIESEANVLLDRLSNGSMSVRFATQREYKDNKREDKKETLDILISDNSNYREYEMFSGGEAFRVNFAIRLALSRVLARRAGARLQTLVIDEGFGSQDADGRQRLIEAINIVRGDFSKILVITHLEELKDSFPARIEVEKDTAGSSVRVALA